MPEYPHTIDNGDGERLTFVARRGDALEVRNAVRPGGGPPMHVHHLQEEGGTVEQGRMGYVEDGGPERFAGPGESVTFPAGCVHRFWNAGEDELVFSGTISPPGNIEYFLGEVYASTRRNGGGRPGLFDAAFLSLRYRSEFAITEIPAPVRRFAFPVIVAVGRLLGRYGRYADAPPPLPAREA